MIAVSPSPEASRNTHMHPAHPASPVRVMARRRHLAAVALGVSSPARRPACSRRDRAFLHGKPRMRFGSAANRLQRKQFWNGQSFLGRASVRGTRQDPLGPFLSRERCRSDQLAPAPRSRAGPSAPTVKRLFAVALLVAASGGLCGCGASTSRRTPENRLIVLGQSIGGIRLDEPRRSVEAAFGRGSLRRRGLVAYFEGRLVIDYWFHDQLTTRVESVETRWGGFHTRSGIHVGSTRQALRDALHVTCREGRCGLAAGHKPDAPGTGFTMRHGDVAEIYVAYS